MSVGGCALNPAASQSPNSHRVPAREPCAPRQSDRKVFARSTGLPRQTQCLYWRCARCKALVRTVCRQITRTVFASTLHSYITSSTSTTTTTTTTTTVPMSYLLETRPPWLFTADELERIVETNRLELPLTALRNQRTRCALVKRLVDQSRVRSSNPPTEFEIKMAVEHLGVELQRLIIRWATEGLDRTLEGSFLQNLGAPRPPKRRSSEADDERGPAKVGRTEAAPAVGEKDFRCPYYVRNPADAAHAECEKKRFPNPRKLKYARSSGFMGVGVADGVGSTFGASRSHLSVRHALKGGCPPPVCAASGWAYRADARAGSAVRRQKPYTATSARSSACLWSATRTTTAPRSAATARSSAPKTRPRFSTFSTRTRARQAR